MTRRWPQSDADTTGEMMASFMRDVAPKV